MKNVSPLGRQSKLIVIIKKLNFVSSRADRCSQTVRFFHFLKRTLSICWFGSIRVWMLFECEKPTPFVEKLLKNDVQWKPSKLQSETWCNLWKAFSFDYVFNLLIKQQTQIDFRSLKFSAIRSFRSLLIHFVKDICCVSFDFIKAFASIEKISVFHFKAYTQLVRGIQLSLSKLVSFFTNL